ncbi:MAG: MFS transporter [Deltaproteobacteria bacterium]|jgi:MFS family permease|nr:MFS transporter [Deltaproteobacteria bacterium]MDA8298644.1 MFS transporter [Deltaproteobacteria bacterium]
MEPKPTPVSAKPVSTKRLLIAILSTIALADFGLGLNTVVLPLYAKSLGASIIAIGLIIASFGLARIFVNIPISIISKKLNAQYIHIGILSIFLGAVGYLLSTSYYQLFLFRFLEGFGSGIINTSSMIILTKRLYKEEKRAKVLSRYMIARRLSMGSAPFIGALVAYEFSDKAAFLLYALIMAAGVIIAFYNKKFLNSINHIDETSLQDNAENVKENIKIQTDTEDNSIENIYIDTDGRTSIETADADKNIGINTRKKYFALLYNFNFIALCFLTFTFFFSRIGSRRELVPLVGYSVMGLNKADIGLLVSISAVIGVVLTYYSDRVINFMGVKKSIITSFIITVAGVLSFIIFKNLISFGLSIILLSAGGGFSGPARNLYLMDSVDKNRYDEAIGIYRTLSDFGFVLGPVAVGAAFDYFNYINAYSLVAFILIFATILFGFFAKSYRNINNPVVTD